MPYEPELSPTVASREKGLRTGYTTGTCASAAAKAAAIGLVHGGVPLTVDVALPSGQRVSFPVERERAAGLQARRAAVVKDAGDDPDCTHGARITADVAFREEIDLDRSRAQKEGGSGHLLLAGPGIGTVTKPGLGIPLGAPSITKVPRRMIAQALDEVTTIPLIVTFSVPGGEDMAADTTNARLGIIGGISILGTTGIVRPFSTAAYRASVVQQIDVAAAQGIREIVLCTGHRSELAAARLWPGIDPVAIVEVGDFTGIALRRAVADGILEVHMVYMAGKLTKLAQGVMMTHYHRSDVDTALLAELATEAGAPRDLANTTRESATARHFFEACIAAGDLRPLQLIAERAKRACSVHVDGALGLDVLMVDYEGDQVMARA